MSGQVTNFGSKYFLKRIFGGFDPADNEYSMDQWWIALVKTEPRIMVSGSELDEVVAESYQRGQYQNSRESWQTSGYESIFNSTAIEFPIANEDWGEVSYFAVCDSKTGGNVFAYGDLSTKAEVIAGDQVTISIGGLSFTLFNQAYEGN